MNSRISGVVFFCCISLTAAFSRKVIEILPQDGDMTATVRSILEAVDDKDLVLKFTKGTYFFKPDYALTKYCYVTNHDNGLKSVIFNFSGLNSIDIQGNGAEFVFHGQILPFIFKDCGKVNVRDLTIDWDIPFTIQGEVVSIDSINGCMDLKMGSKGFSWNLNKGRLSFPNIDGYNYSQLGSSLPFDKQHRRVVHGAYDANSRPSKVERLSKGILRFNEHRKYYPPLGSIVNFKGPKGENRYAPAFHFVESNNIIANNVIIHHALGMGFLMERCDQATLIGCGVFVRPGSDRVVSTTADATHFANCKGDILIENCRFEHMLDDGTNVHGTYVEVDKIIDNRSVRVELKHFQQLGFKFADAGDEMWLIHNPNPDRASTHKVKRVEVVNDRFMIIHFEDVLPEQLSEGDLLENKTWNPTFTMRGCTIKDHRARNVVLKTPKKIVIENNNFSSMMSSIFFRGESFFWFESGGVEDVVIRNNNFNYCAYSGSEHAVLYITPRLGVSFDQEMFFDRNIRFENNKVETFDNRIVWADRVDGLSVTGNQIYHNPSAPPLYPDASLFDFTNCKNVTVAKNTYIGSQTKIVKSDSASRKRLEVVDNVGFSNVQN